MPDSALAVAVGFLSGVLSGQFGIGGGLITTPAIRLLLGQPAIIAVGTPLPVIIPTAIVGASSYARHGLADVRAGLAIGASGAAASVAGAFGASIVGGSALLVATAALLAYFGIDMMLATLRGRENGVDGRAEPYAETTAGAAPHTATAEEPRPRMSPRRLVVLGVGAGLYSGLLGLGGGVVIVPLLVKWLRYPVKRAIGTSLVAISVMAVPGSIAHWALGHVDVRLAALLSIGVVPGALVGAHVTQAARETTARIAFAGMLMVAAAALVVSESGLL